MSSPSSGERYEEEEEEEEEDGAYESQAKRLKPSAAAEEGEIEYSGAEESEGRRDKPPASRGGGGGFSGGVRDAGPAGRGRLPSGCRRGEGTPPAPPLPRARLRPPPPLLPGRGPCSGGAGGFPRPRGLPGVGALCPLPRHGGASGGVGMAGAPGRVRAALPAAGERSFLTARGHGPGRQPEGGMGVRDAGSGAHGLPPFRGQLGASRGIAIAS